MVMASGYAPICGVLSILSCPPALCPHVEFLVADVLGVQVSLAWADQPACPGTMLATLEWRAGAGTAERLAIAVRRVRCVPFDVTEEASPGCDGERLSYTPQLGLFRSATAANGDVAVGEGPLRELQTMAASRAELAQGLDALLGTSWDEALEPLRRAGDGSPVTWLPLTG